MPPARDKNKLKDPKVRICLQPSLAVTPDSTPSCAAIPAAVACVCPSLCVGNQHVKLTAVCGLCAVGVAGWRAHCPP